MIHEVDEVLKGLLGGGALAGSGIDIAFDAPTRDWAARRNSPTINAYLYDIREDVNRRQRGHMPVHDERDVVVKRRQPPRWFRLSYLVTAWTKQPQDEHRLLSAVLATLIPRELIAPTELPGALGELGLTVPLSVMRHPDGVPVAGGNLVRPRWRTQALLDLVVTAPFPAYPSTTPTARHRGRRGPPPHPGRHDAGHGERAHRPAQVAAAREARTAGRAAGPRT